ncbi:MAG: biopolymer transporter TolR [Blastocatellia bacterium]|nr:MAG: biopolymer transporter TolR [Blastocatellia bacterium]
MNKTRILQLILVTLIVLMSSNKTLSQQTSLGAFGGQTDVGSPVHSGGASYDTENQEYTIEGSGTNMWAVRDEFHFVWQRLTGNFILTANARFISKGVEEHRKIGWIVRSNLDADAAQASVVLHGNGLTSLQFRRTKAGNIEEKISSIKAPNVLQLERRGNRYIMSVAQFGETFTSDEVSLDLGEEVYVGLFVCSHNKDVTEKAAFNNVRITVPANENFVPYRDYIGSNLEIMDVATGGRKTIYTAKDSFQAPNWTKDGRALIYNRNGRLYRFDLKNNIPEPIDTGFAINNNNDHVLSFDGKMLAISNHSKDDGNASIVYTVPVAGGTPRRVTSNGPSYLHGWSPDAKFLVYTGGRNNEFDIYKISVKGGEETNLTNSKGLDDGPEYTPDGKYIYFNSTRSGTMQIWRMKPDGSSQEQVTNDEFNNWFPHISPDGKWIVFLSFLKDVAPTDHPFYKHVYIRLMPIDQAKPKVIAYVYGGQGTINVPSWSPDSKRIAFVSNTTLN